MLQAVNTCDLHDVETLSCCKTARVHSLEQATRRLGASSRRLEPRLFHCNLAITLQKDAHTRTVHEGKVCKHLKGKALDEHLPALGIHSLHM